MISINSYSIVDMELSSDVINGLKLVADTAKIPDKYFVILLKNTINTLVESKPFEPPHGTLHLSTDIGGGRVRLIAGAVVIL